MRLEAAGFLAVWCACSDPAPPAEARAAHAPQQPVAPGAAPPEPTIFTFAEPEVSSEDPPARLFSLPTTNAELASARGPALVHLNLEQPQRLDELMTALRSASSKGLTAELRAWFKTALGDPTAKECALLRPFAEDPTLVASARELVLSTLARCKDPALAVLFERPGVSDELVLEFFSSVRTRVPRSERLLQAAGNRVARAKSGPDVMLVGLALRQVDGLQARDLKKVLAKTTRAEVRGEVKSAFVDSPDEALAALADNACREAPLAFACFGQQRRVACGTGKPPPPENLDECVASPPALAPSCLQDEFDADRARATAYFVAHPGLKETAGVVGEVARSLAAFPDGKFEEGLLRMGVLSGAADAGAELTVGAVLAAAERSVAVTGTSSPPALLLTQLAVRTPKLGDVLFEDGAEPRQLRAWADGKRYVVALEGGEERDVKAMVGLLNALAVARHSEHRFVAFRAGLGTHVVSAPAGGLQKLVKTGVLEPGSKGSAGARP